MLSLCWFDGNVLIVWCAARFQDGGATLTQLSVIFTKLITQVCASLKSVKTLHIKLPSKPGPDVCENDSEETAAVSACLLPLVLACPNLVHLTIVGRVSPELLQAFGSSCPKLSSFQLVPTSQTISTLTQLSVMLPRLTHLSVLPPSWYAKQGHHERGVSNQLLSMGYDPIRTVLVACPNLHHVETTLYEMTNDVWGALPLGLHSLVTSAPGYGKKQGLFYIVPSPLVSRQQHHRLTSLMFCDSEDEIGLRELVLVLRDAPNLMELGSRNHMRVTAKSASSCATDLGALDARVAQGLRIVTKDNIQDYGFSQNQKHREIPLQVDFHLSRTSPWEKFITPSTTSYPSLTHVSMFSGPRAQQSYSTKVDMWQLPRVFPNLAHFTAYKIALQESNFAALGACTMLEEVNIKLCTDVLCAGLTALLGTSDTLDSFSCINCKEVTRDDETAMKILGLNRAIHVSVVNSDWWSTVGVLLLPQGVSIMIHGTAVQLSHVLLKASVLWSGLCVHYEQHTVIDWAGQAFVTRKLTMFVGLGGKKVLVLIKSSINSSKIAAS